MSTVKAKILVVGIVIVFSVILGLVVYCSYLSNKNEKLINALTISESNNNTLKLSIHTQNNSIKEYEEIVSKFKVKKVAINTQRKDSLNEIQNITPDKLVDVFNNRLLTISSLTY